MIFQDPFGSLNPVHTIGHHLDRPLQDPQQGARPGRDAGRGSHELLATVGLNPPAEFAAKFPHELSGGQRQRVAFARALAVDPELMLADEPISMLDVSIRMGILNLMERLKDERGIAYLYITHDIASARYIGDRTNVMYAGRMVEGAPSEELVSSPGPPLHEAAALRRARSPRPDADAGRGPGRGAVADRSTPRLPVCRPLPARDGGLPRGHAGRRTMSRRGTGSAAICTAVGHDAAAAAETVGRIADDWVTPRGSQRCDCTLVTTHDTQ